MENYAVEKCPECKSRLVLAELTIPYGTEMWVCVEPGCGWEPGTGPGDEASTPEECAKFAHIFQTALDKAEVIRGGHDDE